MGDGEGCKCDTKIFILEKGKNIFTALTYYYVTNLSIKKNY